MYFSFHSRDVFVFTKKERDMMTKLGYFVLEKINSETRVFPSTILATIMLQHQEGINKGYILDNTLYLHYFTIYIDCILSSK